MQVLMISPEDVAIILQKEEGHFLDFKSREIAPGKLTQSISAFANAAGGEIYVGVTESNGLSGKVKA